MSVHVKRNMMKIVIAVFVLIALFSLVRLEVNNQIDNNKIVTNAEISSQIYINGNDGWTNLKNSGGCTGSGLPSDPYIIRDLVIDGGGSDSCIGIDNTLVYFIIENCELFNSAEYGFHAANVANGKIINNDCSNNGVGIGLDQSADMIVQGNMISYNTFYGISIYESNRNIICGNTITYNDETAIYLEFSQKNQLFKNIVSDNGQWGIAIVRTATNEIYGNQLRNNAGGSIYFEDSSCVIFFQNDIDDDTMEYVIQNMCPFTSELMTYLVIGVLMLLILSIGVIVQKRSIKPREERVEKKGTQVEEASKSDEMIEVEETREEKAILEMKEIPSRQIVEEEITPVEVLDMAEKTVIRAEKVKILESEEKSPYTEVETEYGQIKELEEVSSEKPVREMLPSSQIAHTGEADIVKKEPIKTEEIFMEEGISSEEAGDKESIAPQERDISEKKVSKDYESEAEVAEKITMLPTGNLVCPYCGFNNPDDTSYCLQCGQTIKKQKK